MNNKNMVDERFECLSVIFRLAGYSEYNDLELDYQKDVAEKFAGFANHEAVKYAKNLKFSYNKVFKFAVHIDKKDDKFLFIENINSLLDGDWNEENTVKFLELFNKFYIDTNYKEFFNSYIEWFTEITQRFIEKTYGKIDLKWFGKYIDSSNLRCIYSPSSGNYGATVNDKIVYCLVYGLEGPVVHEYCHSFANPLAEKWYNENSDFKKWVDESINIEKMPYYNNSTAMKNEYVTRAYHILYEFQHGADLNERISMEINAHGKDTFKYIEEVYNMVLELENTIKI